MRIDAIRMKGRCPRIADNIVTIKQCRWCEKTQGPCDQAEDVRSCLSMMQIVLEAGGFLEMDEDVNSESVQFKNFGMKLPGGWMLVEDPLLGHDGLRLIMRYTVSKWGGGSIYDVEILWVDV